MTNHFSGPNTGVIQVGDQNTASVVHQLADRPELLAALQALADSIRDIEPTLIREEGEFHLAQVTRVIERHESPAHPLERLSNWLGASAASITNVAVIWGLISAVGDMTGYPLPAAPEGLGQ